MKASIWNSLYLCNCFTSQTIATHSNTTVYPPPPPILLAHVGEPSPPTVLGQRGVGKAYRLGLTKQDDGGMPIVEYIVKYKPVSFTTGLHHCALCALTSLKRMFVCMQPSCLFVDCFNLRNAYWSKIVTFSVYLRLSFCVCTCVCLHVCVFVQYMCVLMCVHKCVYPICRHAFYKTEGQIALIVLFCFHMYKTPDSERIKPTRAVTGRRKRPWTDCLISNSGKLLFLLRDSCRCFYAMKPQALHPINATCKTIIIFNPITNLARLFVAKLNLQRVAFTWDISAFAKPQQAVLITYLYIYCEDTKHKKCDHWHCWNLHLFSVLISSSQFMQTYVLLKYTLPKWNREVILPHVIWENNFAHMFVLLKLHLWPH